MEIWVKPIRNTRFLNIAHMRHILYALVSEYISDTFGNPFANGWLFLLNTPRSLQHFCSFTRFATRPPPHPPDLAAPPHKLDDIHDCRPFLGPPWSWRGRGTDGPRVGLLGGQTHDGPLPLSMSGDACICVCVYSNTAKADSFSSDFCFPQCYVCLPHELSHVSLDRGECVHDGST